MIWLVSYDISNNKYRKRLSDKLIYFGLERLQKSVFIGDISYLNKSKLYKYFVILQKEMLEQDDKIFCTSLSKNELKKSNFIGGISADEIESIAGRKKVQIY